MTRSARGRNNYVPIASGNGGVSLSETWHKPAASNSSGMMTDLWGGRWGVLWRMVDCDSKQWRFYGRKTLVGPIQ